MKKQQASFYTADRLHEEIPLKIIAYFVQFSRVAEDETIYAAFGSFAENSVAIENSVLVLKDRIEYAETKHIVTKFKTVTLNYIDQVYLLSEGNWKYVSIVDRSKSSTSIKIGSSIESSTAFYNLVKQMSTGAAKQEDSVVLSKNIECPYCGAGCIIYKRQESHCEYCHSPLAWQD